MTGNKTGSKIILKNDNNSDKKIWLKKAVPFTNYIDYKLYKEFPVYIKGKKYVWRMKRSKICLYTKTMYIDQPYPHYSTNKCNKTSKPGFVVCKDHFRTIEIDPILSTEKIDLKYNRFIINKKFDKHVNYIPFLLTNDISYITNDLTYDNNEVLINIMSTIFPVIFDATKESINDYLPNDISDIILDYCGKSLSQDQIFIKLYTEYIFSTYTQSANDKVESIKTVLIPLIYSSSNYLTRQRSFLYTLYKKLKMFIQEGIVMQHKDFIQEINKCLNYLDILMYSTEQYVCRQLCNKSISSEMIKIISVYML